LPELFQHHFYASSVLITDYWQLRSAEESHTKNPDTFWIPTLEERQSLQRGQAARLIFDIEVADEGKAKTVGERMWVIVTEKIGEDYIGVLDNQPACMSFEDGFYLRFGAEVPFSVQHVIDIGSPPQEYVDWQLSLPPEGVWSRE
jgi:hypothetical protein